jgi:maleylpyruvate isomerase
MPASDHTATDHTASDHTGSDVSSDDTARGPGDSGTTTVPQQVTTVLQMVETSADSLRRSVTRLGDAEVAAPSALPGWTRGHVLTHLARNADALVNLLTWARTGVETPMYSSRQARDDAIEAGAGRPAGEQRADVESSQQRLMAAASGLGAADWRAPVRWGYDARECTADLVPWLRLVELEVHHVDLDVGYTPAHWPADFVRDQLGRAVDDRRLRDDTPPVTLRAIDADTEHVLRDGPGPVVSGPQATLLAWLLGRSTGTGLAVQDSGAAGAAAAALPTLAPWR